MPTKTDAKKPSAEPARKSTAPASDPKTEKSASEAKESEERDQLSVAERLRKSAQTLCLQAIEPAFRPCEGRRMSVEEKNAEIAMKKKKMEALLKDWEAIECAKYNDLTTDKDISDYRQRIFEVKRALKNPDGLFLQRLAQFQMSAKEMASLSSAEMVSNELLAERERLAKERFEKEVVVRREEEREAEKLRQTYYRELRDMKNDDREGLLPTFAAEVHEDDDDAMEVDGQAGADVAVTYAELPVMPEVPVSNAEDKRFSMTGIDAADITSYEKDDGRWSFAAPPGVAPVPPAFGQPPNTKNETESRSGGGAAAKKDVEMGDESSKQENQAVKVSNLNEYHDVILHGIKGVQLGHHHGPPRKKERLLDEIEEYMTPEPIPLDALLDMEKPEVILQRTTTAEYATRYMIFSERRPEYAVGRDYVAGADYIINTSGEKCISRMHAVLKLRRMDENDKNSKKFLCVKDVSANGTWVNGEKIGRKEWETLYPGDTISFGADTGVPKFIVKSGQDSGVFTSTRSLGA